MKELKDIHPFDTVYQEGYKEGCKNAIDKALKWISYTEDNNGFEFDGWEEDFRKFMEDTK